MDVPFFATEDELLEHLLDAGSSRWLAAATAHAAFDSDDAIDAMRALPQERCSLMYVENADVSWDGTTQRLWGPSGWDRDDGSHCSAWVGDSDIAYDFAAATSQGILSGGFPKLNPMPPAPPPHIVGFSCIGPYAGLGCSWQHGFSCQAVTLLDAHAQALMAGWFERLDGAVICADCFNAAVSASQAPSAYHPSASSAPTQKQPPTLRPADLLTYCDHCGFGLVGSWDPMTLLTELRCPKTHEVKQTISDYDRDQWPEWALDKLFRMMRD